MSAVLCSAADARYGNYLLNLIGSVKANSDIFDRIVVYDLGFDAFQHRLASSIRGVELRAVPPFVPHWSQGRTWKPWIWTHVEGDTIVWLDAGLTVLRPLTHALDQIAARGYFLVSQGHPMGDSIPSDYYDLYAFPRELGARTSVAAGIIGFRKKSPFYSDVVVRTYEDALAGRSLGASAGEVEHYNVGIEWTTDVVIRDCPRFRHEQTLLNIHVYRSLDEPVIDDLDRYAGYRSPRDHPEQVIWSHRRRGDFRYLTRVPYRAAMAPRGLAWGAWFRFRWWKLNHSWLFRPEPYIRKLRQLTRLS